MTNSTLLEPLFTAVLFIGETIEIIGVLAIVIGFLLATINAAYRFWWRENRHHDLFRYYRRSLARSVLVGLEFLVAGDIIRTVGGDLTLEKVAVLIGVVAVRIVLGMTLEAEIANKPLTLDFRGRQYKKSATKSSHKSRR